MGSFNLDYFIRRQHPAAGGVQRPGHSVASPFRGGVLAGGNPLFSAATDVVVGGVWMERPVYRINIIQAWRLLVERRPVKLCSRVVDRSAMSPFDASTSISHSLPARPLDDPLTGSGLP